MKKLHTFYKRPEPQMAVEECYYFEMAEVSEHAEAVIRFLLEEEGRSSRSTMFPGAAILEIGPRVAMETPFSSNARQILAASGVSADRVESSIRVIAAATDLAREMRAGVDRMTQMIYEKPLTTFKTGLVPEGIWDVDIMERGEDALREANKKEGLGMDEWDIGYYTSLFQKLGRNPTIVECFQLGNANSEHSRHWFFRGIQKIDGTEMPETLMDIVQEAWKRNPGNSLVAFHDNAGVIYGTDVSIFVRVTPEAPSSFTIKRVLQHISATAETHNHPTMVAPFPGAETGSGGRIRDNRAVGRGALVHSGLAGYCVGNLHLPTHDIPGEESRVPAEYPYASALDILVKGSNGVSDYGNKIGEPLLGGFCRSFGQIVEGTHREFTKPVLYSAGVGRILDVNLTKKAPEKGMCIVRIGGPAYRIGVGGGSASSMLGGASDAELDFKSVQRGNAEMENRVNRVIQACAEMGSLNPIESIHDQGAGGPSNVITELMEPAGGRVDIRKINLGDSTMSVLEIWVAEYQEGYGLLIRPERLEEFQAICERERVNCEVLGEITGDGNVVVTDSRDGSVPVHLSLKDILSEMPQKTFPSEHLPRKLEPLVIPEDLTMEKALEMVFRQLSVGSKGFLTRKVDRSVTGLVAQQQCVGPMQLPVADASVTADGYFGHSGAVSTIGEQPLKMLIDPARGARLSVAEMLTNMAGVCISKLEDIKCRANWMWAAKLPGQGALLYDAAKAMSEMMTKLGIAPDGGKDSLSMAAKVGTELIVSPGQLVILGYAPVPDITKKCTPDFKRANSFIGYLDLGSGLGLGGSAFAQALGMLGDECADADSSILGSIFRTVQELMRRGLIAACHDVSDGGLITTIVEMCLAGNRAAQIRIPDDVHWSQALFHERPGLVLEIYPHDLYEIEKVLDGLKGRFEIIGVTSAYYSRRVLVQQGPTTLWHANLADLRRMWEATSTRLEMEQADESTVREEEKSFGNETILDYRVSFSPVHTDSRQYPKALIIREEGTNGDREMAAACYEAGFEPWDINMQDLLDGRVRSFEDARFVVFPGGFSFADVFGSAKGWAAGIRFNPRVKEMFDTFFARKDTISLGVCNGCQLMAQLGVLFPEYEDDAKPLLTHNLSRRFESRWVNVEIRPSSSVFLRGMAHSRLGIWVAHGEGRFHFPIEDHASEIRKTGCAPIVYLDPEGFETEMYPYNPNGSPFGFAALTSADGRHLAMMPHPERCFKLWQWAWMPEHLNGTLVASPWLRMFQNAREWCER